MTEAKLQPNPYKFIERLDPDKPGSFTCSHKEAKGSFVCKELTVRDLSRLETLQAAIQGGALTERADALARWQAWSSLGFEQKPEGLDVSKVKSESLLHALYLEAKAHYEFFRDAPLEGAFQFDPEAAL